jgi:phospholipid/cholesterol/gamma-HCH transport system substrate-binding protein
VRRTLIVTGLLLALVAGAVVAIQSGESSRYQVAAIFDTAKGMVPGQQVKIAGAVVGKVEQVELTRAHKARMLLSVAQRFAPFHPDATCQILPEGLISENYIECDPGTARGALKVGEGGTPAVPIRQTAVPASLQGLIDVFSLPTDERLRALIDELGLATAGRGEDLNAILRRANPALTQSRRVLAIIDAQRRQVTDAVRQTDRVVADLAARDGSVRRFVDRAAAVADTTAAHRTSLSETVRRLPPMLDAVRPALRSLDRTTGAASPLLDSLRTSAPGLMRLTRTLPSFSASGTPALRAFSAMAETGRGAVRSARPFVSALDSASARSIPFAEGLDQFLTATRDGGGFEGLAHLLYAEATSTASYDQVSHMYSIFNEVFPRCMQDHRASGCSHEYSAPGHGTLPINDPQCGPQRPSTFSGLADPCGPATTPVRARRRNAPPHLRHHPRPSAAPPANASPPGPSARPGPLPHIELPHPPVEVPKPPVDVPTPPAPSPPPPALPPLPTPAPRSQHVEALLDYLLGP